MSTEAELEVFPLHRLKQTSVAELERKIAAVIAKLVGEQEFSETNVSINNVEYAPMGSVKFSVTLSTF